GITFINPYGWRLHRFVLSYLLGGEGIYREISARVTDFWDMRRAWFLFTPLELVTGVAVIALVVAALFDRRYRARAALCALLVAAALRQVRHFELAGLLSFVLLGPIVEALWRRARHHLGWSSSSAPSSAALGVLVLFPAIAVSSVMYGRALAVRSA